MIMIIWLITHLETNVTQSFVLGYPAVIELILHYSYHLNVVLWLTYTIIYNFNYFKLCNYFFGENRRMLNLLSAKIFNSWVINKLLFSMTLLLTIVKSSGSRTVKSAEPLANILRHDKLWNGYILELRAWIIFFLRAHYDRLKKKRLPIFLNNTINITGFLLQLVASSS